MRILILTQNYPPDLSAGAFRMSALVENLRARDCSVTVLTGVPNRYASLKISSKEFRSSWGETVVRINRLKQNGGGIFLRSLGDLQYFLKALFFLIGHRRSWDVVCATSPHLLVGVLGALAGKISSVPFVLDVRDLWPEVMIDLGYLKKKSVLYQFLQYVEKRVYGAATQIIINSPAFKKEISRFVQTQIFLVTNGIDDGFGKALKELPSPSGKGGMPPFTIVYAGNLGVAQDLKILLDVAPDFIDRFNFILVGDGSDKEALQALAQEKNTTNISFRRPCARGKLLKHYVKGDAFFVHLKNIPMFTKTIPSKIFEYCATGKPVVYGLQGVAKNLMEDLQGNRFAFSPGNVAELHRVLEQLFEDLVLGFSSFPEGQEKVCHDYLRSVLSQKMANILLENGASQKEDEKE